MKFAVIDKKKSCFSVFCNGNIHLRHLPDEATHTWSYSPHYDKKVELGSIYANSWGYDKVCPAYLKESWKNIQKKLNAYLISAREAKVPMEDVCYYDILPEEVLLEFCQIKVQIIEHVFQTYSRPNNYEFMYSLMEMLDDISNRVLKLDVEQAFFFRKDLKIKHLFTGMNLFDSKICFNPFSAITGRLITTHNSFPILNLKREHRAIIQPQNNFFVEFDYNSADLRTVLALTGKEQPQEDLHDWNGKNLFPGVIDRQTMKQKIFQDLYSAHTSDPVVSSVYNKEQIIKQYWNGEKISTPFDREIKLSDRRLVTSYVVQSVTSDLVLSQAIKLFNFLKGRKSFIAFIIHDCVVLDVAEDEIELIKEAKQIFSETIFGKYLLNTSIGSNYGSMRRIS